MTVRELNGWSPRTVTLDADGELMSVAVTEPRFTAAERATLLASRRADTAPRGGHGVLLSTAVDPANQFRFEVPPPITDHAEMALSKAKQEWQRANPDADPRTRLWQARLRD